MFLFFNILYFGKGMMGVAVGFYTAQGGLFIALNEMILSAKVWGGGGKATIWRSQKRRKK
jgi:hypothetical protein